MAMKTDPFSILFIIISRLIMAMSLKDTKIRE